MIRAALMVVSMILILATGGAAGAGSYREAAALYDAGRFEEAAMVAERLETAAGDALAARAFLLQAAYLAGEGEDVVLLERGQAAAERALDRDPDNVEAMLHLVIALGYRSRLEKPMAAHDAGYARRARGLLKRARKTDPDNPWVWATWGGWHGEITRSAGDFLAGFFYGASAREARESFERAIALAPDNPAIRVEYAKVLLGMGEAYRKEARDMLDEAAHIPPRNAFEKLIRDQGARLMEAMGAGDNALKAALHAVTPFAQ